MFFISVLYKKIKIKIEKILQPLDLALKSPFYQSADVDVQSFSHKQHGNDIHHEEKHIHGQHIV